jgi:sensor histidine kinase regulating citrate/malate metabolism
VGIEPWRLATIFDAGASTTADTFAPAHGLGLWWTRAQVEGYGGTIEIASQPGQGTSVTVRLRAVL